MASLVSSWAMAEPNASSQVFEKRLRPILTADTASSCTECHFSGVELRNFLRESEAETFAALRQQGWIDPKRPEQSKLLTFIARKPDKPDPLLEKVREAELKAFQEWIAAAVKNPELLAAKPTKPLETELPVEVIRHARRDRVLSAFVDSVWSEMGRCVNCHSPERNRHLVAKHGQETVAAISWLVPNDPAATLERLTADGDIDLDQPEASPLLLKPAGLAEHGGGPKFLAGGETHQKILAFLKDYVATRGGQYRTSAELPKSAGEIAWLTDQHLKLIDLPDSLIGGAIKGEIDRWDESHQRWSSRKVGYVEGPVNAKQRVFQNMVTELAVASDAAAVADLRKQPRLPAGRYRVRLFVDREPDALKSIEHHWQPAGEIEFSGDWPPGYQPPKTVSAKNLKPFVESKP